MQEAANRRLSLWYRNSPHGKYARSYRYVYRDRVKAGNSLHELDLDNLHRFMIEDVLHGYDVLPAAIHLTASTLAMLSPSAAFKRMNLNVMPIGIDQGGAKLGSLDFLSGSRISTQLALDDSQLERNRSRYGRIKGCSYFITNARPLRNEPTLCSKCWWESFIWLA